MRSGYAMLVALAAASLLLNGCAVPFCANSNRRWKSPQ